jgi:2-polyprenyl-6-methoxyphenol hydroxylase-like FAD-dependent oxidoreductase
MKDDPIASGADRAERFLTPFREGCFPGSEAYGNAVPAGPCAFYPGSDSWTDAPLSSRNAVLVGDAAGWSDPIIGQGLSIAMRDARTVSDVLCGDDWSPAAFRAYTGERAERMRRIRFLAHLDTELRCTFTEEGRRRRRAFLDAFLVDPSLFNFTVGLLSGPEIPPPETFTEDFQQRVLTLS